MHNKLLIRKLATEGLKMRRIKKVKCASPGQEQKKNCLPTLTFPNKRPQKRRFDENMSHFQADRLL